MRRLIMAMLLAIQLGPVTGAESTRLSDITREIVLDNGLRLLLVPAPGQPTIAAGWVAHVGSANERPGITGVSHLFEHMMFKGSSRIGTRDFTLDDQLRRELDAIRERMFDEERRYRELVRQGKAESITDPAIRSEEMEAWSRQFEELLVRQRANLVKDEFDQIYTRAGASGMNAFTNQDMTVYFIRVPANKLELWFWMESERLAQPVFREFYSERDVVYEERRARTESTPTGVQDEVFNALFWRGHPYAWPVVGWPSDIAAISRSEAQAYFDQFYAPNNITAAIVGDFDTEQVIAWAQAYFGRIPANRQPPPDVIALPMPLTGKLVYEAQVDAPPSARVSWQTTAFGGVDDPALQVLASVLSGKTGRLYRRLVLEEQIAVGAGAVADSQKYHGSFTVSATGNQAIDPFRLQAVMLDELSKLQADGISDYELTKVKNQLAAAMFRRLEDPFSLMVQLLYFDGLRDWRNIDSYFERILQVTAEEVQSVANKYLVDDEQASRIYRRRPGADTGSAEGAGEGRQDD